MKSRSKLEVTGGAIFRDGKVLIARRKQGKSLAGFWEFPGGKVELGETPEACLKRELREELGLTVSVVGHLGSASYRYPSFDIELIVLVCVTSEEPTHLEAHDKYVWSSIAHLSEYSWAPADLFAVEKLIKEGLPSGL